MKKNFYYLLSKTPRNKNIKIKACFYLLEYSVLGIPDFCDISNYISNENTQNKISAFSFILSKTIQPFISEGILFSSQQEANNYITSIFLKNLRDIHYLKVENLESYQLKSKNMYIKFLSEIIINLSDILLKNDSYILTKFSKSLKNTLEESYLVICIFKDHSKILYRNFIKGFDF